MPAVIVSAAPVKNMPGHKTDQTDAEWIADLRRHGLLRAAGLIPDRERRERRDALTQRRKMVADS